MIEELDLVVLTHDIPDEGLRQGDAVTLTAHDIRLRAGPEILHVREFAPVSGEGR